MSEEVDRAQSEILHAKNEVKSPARRPLEMTFIDKD